MITEEHRRRWLHQIVEAWDRVFDPELGFLRYPESRRLGTEQSPGGDSRAESLHYALALLELAERSRQGRAEAIIQRVINRPTASASPDLALTLLLVWHRHRRRLPDALVEKIVLDLVDAATRLRSRESGRRSSAMINDLFLLLSVAKIAGDEEWMSRAWDQFDRVEAAFAVSISFLCAADPDDAAAGLAGLHAIDSCISDSRVSERAGALLSRFWREVTDVFYAPDRAATRKTLEPDLLALLVEKASRGVARGRVGSGRETFVALYACVMKVEAPPAVPAGPAACDGKPRETGPAAFPFL